MPGFPEEEAMTTRPTKNDKDSLHARATRKVMLRLLPVMFGVYFMSYIDRTNVALAKTHLATDVGIGAAAYGFGAGIFFIGYFLRRCILDRVKLRLSIRMIETLFKQTRRTRMIFRRARPEHSILLFNFLPGDTVVICVSAARGYSHFIEDCARVSKLKILFPAHSARDLLDDPPVGASFTGRVGGLVNLQDTALAVCCDALVFTPRAARKNNVGITRAF